jgi:hypothetical protein
LLQKSLILAVSWPNFEVGFHHQGEKVLAPVDRLHETTILKLVVVEM